MTDRAARLVSFLTGAAVFAGLLVGLLALVAGWVLVFQRCGVPRCG